MRDGRQVRLAWVRTGQQHLSHQVGRCVRWPSSCQKSHPTYDCSDPPRDGVRDERLASHRRLRLTVKVLHLGAAVSVIMDALVKGSGRVARDDS